MSSKENFNAFFNYFDQVYILTIASAKERHISMKEEFGDWNVKVIYGIDKKDVDIDDLDAKGIIDKKKNAEIDPKSNYTKGLICASWGHRLIYEDMIEYQYQHVLILEDDALLVEDYPNDIGEVLKHLPTDADLVYWGWLGGVHQNMQQSFFKRRFKHLIKKWTGQLKQFDNELYEGLVAEPYNKYFDKAGKHGGAHAYSINLKTAKMFVEMQTPIVFHPDRIFTYVLEKEMANVYLAIPPVITEASYSGNAKVLPSMLDYR